MKSADVHTGRPDRPATWRSVFAVREFRRLWVASALSMLGDELARVALAVLVYTETSSALLTALVFALTMLPWLIGGPLLSGLADRYPRRTVMITCTVASGGLVAVMAVPWLPLPVLCVILFAVVLLEPPFRSARAALLVDVLPDDRYTLASAVNLLTHQGTQVLGFAAGGALITVLGPRPALLLDAVTFIVAALLIRWASPHRPAAASANAAGEDTTGWGGRMSTGARIVFGDPALRRLVLLAWLASFWIVPEGLAAPYAHTLGGAAVTVGLLMAAQPAGTALGTLLLTRFVAPARRLELLVPLAALSGAPLLLCALQPPLPIVLAALTAAGLGSSYQTVANATFMQTVPTAVRAQAFGLVGTGLTVGQGLGLLVGGAAAELLSPPLVIAAAGALGLLVVALSAGSGAPR